MSYIAYNNTRKMKWGVGHHLKNIWTTHTLGAEFNLETLRGDIPGPWAKWTDFLNFNDGLKSLEDPTIKDLKRINIEKSAYGGTDLNYFREIIEKYKNDNVIFYFEGNTRYFLSQMKDIKKRKEIRNRFVECYWSKRKNNPILLDLDTSKINVAVHIRRGDVNKNDSGVKGKMWIGDEYFYNIMKEINKLGNVKFRIYSNHGQKFEKFINDKELDVELVLGLNRNPENEFKIFHQMLNSDILIGSPSNFTYILGEMGNMLILMLERIVKHPLGNYSLTPFSDDLKVIDTKEDGSFSFLELKEKLNNG